MARHTTLTFSAADLEALGAKRYAHPDPRVQQRMEVLWLISCTFREFVGRAVMVVRSE
ncbi:hypothetical protein GobsT_43250 [Gemmata obscuriglobus]|uniref:hypothetical protein n=1 Tax=Gemmata obscuriglobus TaxID=114 RepID=UPI00016C350C|nr:hypothetical protein [Gemmata obscuriglobus]QEG29529.1 hypothetical protein GobsT_43250 [Gemmata obscuriglobus]VTS08731.1 unnamed protein product [Gemmata obscuriglobus UQM 2246]